MRKHIALLLFVIIFSLPYHCANGREADFNLEETIEAAKKGDADAQYHLGFHYMNNAESPADFKEAAQWFTKAAEQGNVEAQYNLGFMYHRGIGVRRNHTEKVRWFLQAAEQGYVPAQSMMGLLYYSGKGIAKDYVQSYMWLSIAASAGDKTNQGTMDQLSQEMPPAQLEEARKLAGEWKPKK